MIALSGCSLTRGLKPNEVLVRKITLNGVDKHLYWATLNYVDKEQQPNNWLNLQFYHIYSHLGEAPRLLDSNLVEFSRVQIEKFLINKGYLKAKVESTLEIKRQRANIVFTATEGPLFKIRKFQDSISDPAVRALYRANRYSFSHIAPGQPFDTDSLAYDRDQIFQLMKRNGYYEFYRQYITFTYDSTFNKSVVDIKMIIPNPDGKNAHEVYRINNTLVTIFDSQGLKQGNVDTLRIDSQFSMVDYSHHFKPNLLTRYIFQRKGDVYNIDKQSLTTARLSELNVFRNVPNPTYTRTNDSTNHKLDSKIDIIPLKRMSDRIEGEFIFNGGLILNAGHIGYNLGNTFTDRNLFGGGEILQLKTNWSVLFDNAASEIGSSAIENQDFRVGLNLIYPRIISPFTLPIPGKYGVPHTTLSSNYQLFFQKGLVERKSLINSLTYDWAETTQKQHSLTPFDIEFSKGNIDPAAEAELLAQNRYSYVYLIGRTIFTSGSQYTYQYNSNKLFSNNTFSYFRGNIDVGGNSLWVLSRLFNTKQDSLGYTIFGQHFAQYAKIETDFRFYHNFSGEREFVFRLNPGIGVPYANSNQLIFEKNFYVGGSNDIRAWLPRTLGPGQFNRSVYGSNDTLRDRLQYLDQFGEIKIVGNAEYRYALLSNFFGAKVNGALFADFGNVWRLKPETDSPNGTFDFSKLFQSTAIGVGTGLRFDLYFFVFRLDAALKFKDPEFNGSDQWVLINHFGELFHTGPFKSTYLATNGQGYYFMQLSFGIGLPF